MKKVRILLSSLILLVMLCGCLKVDVNYSIDEKYMVKLEYNVQVDMTVYKSTEKKEMQNILKDVVANYEARGFVCEGDYQEDVRFTLTLSKQATSYEEAYKFLEEMIVNPEISFFLKAGMDSHIEQYEQVFNFYFETDLNRIAIGSYLEDLPPTIKNSIYDQMKDSEVNLYLTLPTSNVEKANDTVEVITKDRKTTFKLPVSWSEPSIMDLVIRMSLDNGKMTPHSINDSIENTKQQASLYNILFYVGIGGAVLSIGGFGYLSMKKKSK